ncbi:Crossover junction endonuclease mus81 [Modicella reniformis]|uniref:Crossover junction endonuclease MUS81 n=1 Tax=Modicella reniformis TaxID=1440133 RepID=A0A9P6MAA5_9FUNG|nr:Crossover junction endonuclease mus81 [Modicella reniformis]
MAKYPTPFSHPVEAMCLTGIGEKMVGKLEKRLVDHCKDNDLPMPAVPTTRRARKVRDTNGEEEEDEDEPKSKKARTRQKPYVPTYRSGAYAILLVLLDAKTLDGEGALTKQDIQSSGQVYCDASLTNPEHGSFYSAWGSMKTLLNKSLVSESSSFYYLTEAGTAMAKLMRMVNSDDIANPPGSGTDNQEMSTTASASSSSAQEKNKAHNEILQNWSNYRYDENEYDFESWETPQITSEFSASGSSTINSRSISSAATSSSSAPSARALIGGDKDQPVDLLSDSDDEETGAAAINSSLNSQTRPLKTATGTFALSPDSTARTSTFTIKGLKRTVLLPRVPLPSAHTAGAPSKAQSARSSDSTRSPSFKTSSAKRSTSSSGRREEGPVASRYDPFAHLGSDSYLPTDTSVESAPRSLETLARFQPIIFHPENFEICLVLDSREIRTLNDRDYIGDKLREQGISVVKRALDIGDVIWIARLKNPVLKTEIVLDYIVERKRMDDFVSSIKDGRFLEQKFRLRRSGCGHVVYLIETHRPGEAYEIGQEGLRTAMTATQVQDGFFLKRTHNTDQTIEYLSDITKELRRLYASKTLYAIPDENVDRKSYLDLQAHLKETIPDKKYLTTYRAFGLLNSKSDTLTVTDTFVKMLMTVRGLSSEKAADVARIYGTPRALFSSLDELDDDEESQRKRRELLAPIGGGGGKRKIGISLSTKLADIWCSNQYSS